MVPVPAPGLPERDHSRLGGARDNGYLAAPAPGRVCEDRTARRTRQRIRQGIDQPVLVHFAHRLLVSNTSPSFKVTVAGPSTMLLSMMLASEPVPDFHE